MRSSQPSAPLLERWNQLRRLPAGGALFSRLVGWIVPYAGTISPRVLELREGFARVQMRERRQVRNHLKSIHAAALANLAEMTGNLALMSILPPGKQFIVASFTIDYEKKARGSITATCLCPEANGEIQLHIELHDSAGNRVAVARSHCKVR